MPILNACTYVHTSMLLNPFLQFYTTAVGQTSASHHHVRITARSLVSHGDPYNWKPSSLLSHLPIRTLVGTCTSYLYISVCASPDKGRSKHATLACWSVLLSQLRHDAQTACLWLHRLEALTQSPPSSASCCAILSLANSFFSALKAKSVQAVQAVKYCRAVTMSVLHHHHHHL